VGGRVGERNVRYGHMPMRERTPMCHLRRPRQQNKEASNTKVGHRPEPLTIFASAVTGVMPTRFIRMLPGTSQCMLPRETAQRKVCTNGVPLGDQKVHQVVAQRFTNCFLKRQLGGQKVNHLVAKRCTTWLSNGQLGGQSVCHLAAQRCTTMWFDALGG
jgi:hypothetical protein